MNIFFVLCGGYLENSLLAFFLCGVYQKIQFLINIFFALSLEQVLHSIYLQTKM